MSFFARFAQNRGALVGLVILLLMIAMAVLAPVLFPESPWRMVQRPFLPPFSQEGFLLGTELGTQALRHVSHRSERESSWPRTPT